MKEIYVVSKELRHPTHIRNVNLCGFNSEVQASVYCRNYLFDRSTLEDRTNNKIEMSEFDHCTEYSLYTNEYGLITLKVEKIPYIDPFQDC